MAEQHPLQCDFISNGCNGGLGINAVRMIFANGAREEETFQYQGQNAGYDLYDICEDITAPIHQIQSNASVPTM